jgi:hypothetical protein
VFSIAGLYSKGPRFDSRPGGLPSLLDIRGFPHFLHEKGRDSFLKGHVRFLAFIN